MKFIVFILAVIVIILSCMPCTDVEANCNNSKCEIAKSHNNEQQKSDVCSPFCICSCCSGFSINHVVPNIQTLPLLQETNYTTAYHSATVNISLPIWQPPQLKA